MDNKRGVDISIAAALALLGCALSAPARADVLVVNDQLQVRASDVARPARGLTMSAVEAKFGAPSDKHDAVGTPPITRWDYPQFAVFFEKDRVIDAVLPPPASEPSTSPSAAPVSSAPVEASATPTATQEPVAPTPASAATPSDAPIPSGTPAPAAAPTDTAAPSAAPAAPNAPVAPLAPPMPALPAAQSSAPMHSSTSSEDPMGVVPVSIGPPVGVSAATPAASSAAPAAPPGSHP